MPVAADPDVRVARLVQAALPVPVADGPRTLLRALTGAHGRQYLAFLLAFVLVGASWLAHHALFSYVAGSDDRLAMVGLNLDTTADAQRTEQAKQQLIAERPNAAPLDCTTPAGCEN